LHYICFVYFHNRRKQEQFASGYKYFHGAFTAGARKFPATGSYRHLPIAGRQ